ncbi:MAG: hypothetical protein H6933_13030 [Burkholderiaceae bacterium]|nr:hypothetical protein [Rhodoferax sp.]MCP5285814.1 hypothetical protein [Burkholderiaceae bacterium]
MRICIVGNSHIAALKAGHDAEPQAFREHSIEFFGLPGRRFQSLRFDIDRGLVFPDSHAQALALVTGGRFDRVAPEGFDVLVFHGCRVNLGKLCQSLLTGGPPSVRYSKRFLTAGVHGWLTTNETYRVMLQLRVHSQVRIMLSPMPMAAEGPTGSASAGGAPSLDVLQDIEALVDQCCASDGFVFSPQPRQTLTQDARTGSEYSSGSTRLLVAEQHEDDDTAHMNGAYGCLVLKSVLAKLPAC